MYTVSRHWQPGHLLLASTFFQYLQPSEGFFWIKAVSLPGEYNLDVDEFVTASMTFQPITLTEWRDCVRGFEFSTEDYTSLHESFCSFGASFSEGSSSWTIHATTDPKKIDIHDVKHHSFESVATHPPKIEKVYAGRDPRNFLAMGTAFPDKGKLVKHAELKWKVYRPVEGEAEEAEDFTKPVYVANALHPTFPDLYPKVPFDSVPSLGVPLEHTTMKKYIGEFLVKEVTTDHEEAYDHDALQEGDFLVIDGARTHIQVCFQKMTRRSYDDGTYHPDFRASYLEAYSGNKPGRRRNVIGCIEVVFRVYRNFVTPRSNSNEPDVYLEQPLLMEDMPGNRYPDNPNPNIMIPIEDPDPGELSNLDHTFFFGPGGEPEGQEETGMSPRFGGTESEIPSIPVSNEIQQENGDESLVPYTHDQGGPYDESIQAQEQPGGPMAVRAPSFGPGNFQPEDTSIAGDRGPLARLLNRMPDIFGSEDEDFDEATIHNIYEAIEGLVDQLEPEPEPNTDANGQGMEIEEEDEFETGIWSNNFDGNLFSGLGETDEYLVDFNTVRDMARLRQFGDKIAGDLGGDDDYPANPYFTKQDEKLVTEDPRIDLLLQEAAQVDGVAENEPEPEWSFPTTAEDKPERLHPAQYVEVHNYYSNRAGDPNPGRGKWIDAQLMLKRLQLGKFDQVANDIKYLLPGNPDIKFTEEERNAK
ncbi:hypothetical protein TWF132_002475 [Orbilia oligospora]|nr:hypothetical protein TWF132_002475 [Orbilia oligospora]